jgi:hypothetical protein
MTAAELVKYERKWKAIFTVFAVVFVAALLDHLTRHPGGREAIVCYGVGAIAFAACVYSAKKFHDADRIDATKDGLSLLDEDLSVPTDFND